MRIARSIVVAAFAAAALPVAAQEITLKVHHFWPPGAMPPSQLLVPWCDKIAKDSANRLKCQVYPAMQLGGTPPQLVDQVKDGVADIVWTLPGYTAGRFPLMEVFELPFMSANAEATSQAAWEYYEKYAQKEFPGVRMLAVNVHDNGYVHGRDKQVKTLADFKGMKMRAPDAADQQDARRARRDTRGDAAAGALRRVVQGRRRRLPAAVGGDSVDQGPRADQVPQRDRPEVARTLHRGVHAADEPGEVRQPARGPEEGDRRQLGRRAVEGLRPDSGTPPPRPRASSPPTAATPSTSFRPPSSRTGRRPPRTSTTSGCAT